VKKVVEGAGEKGEASYSTVFFNIAIFVGYWPDDRLTGTVGSLGDLILRLVQNMASDGRGYSGSFVREWQM